jgi:hypothetical protein
MKQFDGIIWQGTRKRWLAYLDILGFARLLEEQGELVAISVYEMCLEEIQSNAQRYPKLGFAYFSDTFLIYAPDDSKESLAAIEQSARWFFNILLLKHVPFRGALACGEFLADRSNNVFIGKALVEASRVGGKYNWIGFAVAPSAASRFEELNLPMKERLNYREWEIPFEIKGSKHPETEKGYAYLIGASSPVNGANQFIEVLTDMAKTIENPEVRVKYENTIEFLDKFGVLNVVPRSDEHTA